MKHIAKQDPLFKYRITYNGYPIVNEISSGAFFFPYPIKEFDNSQVYYDDNYGRFFSGDFLNKVSQVYGVFLSDYDHGATISLKRIDHLRVPYRKIPVFKANNLKEIKDAVTQMKRYSPNYKFLYRGQGKVYTIERTDKEIKELYGSLGPVKEPSFLPSFLRKNIDYNTVLSAWLNVGALLLDTLLKNNSEIQKYRCDEKFNLLSLGLAQHYGLPSVGLDLTDNLKVALWFAIYKATYSSKEHVKAELVTDEDSEPTIFIFRCPSRTTFRYSDIVKDFEALRPINQGAYFNYCGWGLAKNKLALDLACAFRVNNSFAKELPDDYTETLFPKQEDDEVLKAFLDIKELYKGTELGNMLEGIYL